VIVRAYAPTPAILGIKVHLPEQMSRLCEYDAASASQWVPPPRFENRPD
jgi:hypothetical protein